MSCEWIRLGLVSDDPAERSALERHAAGCAECAAFLEEDRALLLRVEAFRAASPAPSPELEARIAAALAGEVRRGEGKRGALRLAVGLAAAAVLFVVGASFFYRWVVPDTPEAELAKAVRGADDAERSYARAIARLEVQSRQVLSRASDPSLDARRAAILFAYRDRLAHLDSVIAEVQAFLEENPGNSGGHTVLLSAYKEKTDVLREVLSLQMGDRS